MAKKKTIPQYTSVERKGIQYYRTRILDADGKQVSLTISLGHPQPDKLVPYIITGKEFRHLPASQVLGVFVGFHAINEEIALFGHIHPSFSTVSHS